MSLASAWLEDFRTWVDGLLGDRLSAALAQVKAAVARGTVAQDVAPQVQRCAAVLGTLRAETQSYLAVAAPHHADPDVKERSDRLVAIWTGRWAEWSDPACTRPGDAGERVGMAPAWAAVLPACRASSRAAVTEAGAISTVHAAILAPA